MVNGRKKALIQKSTKMPSMYRPKGKPKKIAYTILGTPPSFAGKDDKHLRKILFNQDTWRSK